MTREEAIKAMRDKTPVIYMGRGSLGRKETYINNAGPMASLRGSIHSIGIIAEVKRTKAIVMSRPHSLAGIFRLADLVKASPDELAFARQYNRRRYSNLEFTY